MCRDAPRLTLAAELSLHPNVGCVLGTVQEISGVSRNWFNLPDECNLQAFPMATSSLLLTFPIPLHKDLAEKPCPPGTRGVPPVQPPAPFCPGLSGRLPTQSP